MTTASVIYRDEPLTVEDYDEVIRSLTDAREQLASGELWRGCAYCGSEEHNPNMCHHNPIVQARMYIHHLDEVRWRCFHCGAQFSRAEEDAARCHFGLSITDQPRHWVHRLRPSRKPCSDG